MSFIVRTLFVGENCAGAEKSQTAGNSEEDRADGGVSGWVDAFEVGQLHGDGLDCAYRGAQAVAVAVKECFALALLHDVQPIVARTIAMPRRAVSVWST